MYPDPLTSLTGGLAEDPPARVVVLSVFCLSDLVLCLGQFFFCHSLYSVRAKSECICKFFQYIQMPGYSITMATKLTLFLLHSVLKDFYFRSLTLLLVSASHSPLKEERSYFSFKKFYGLGGKDLAPCRALGGRSKKEVILYF